ncbi:MAG: sugar phosphate isomerase/epimerase, partial [Planctomycetaceae bacterium]
VEKTLAEISRWGYCGIDESSTFGPHVNSGSVLPERRRAIRQSAQKHNLRIEAIVTHAELTGSLFGGERLDLDAAVDLASELGGDVLTFHLGGPVAGVEPEAVWEKTVEAIAAAARYGDSRHVRLAIDLGPWPTWIVRDSAELARLFTDVNSPTFGVNFDPSYLAVQEIDPLRFIHRFGDRIRHAHLKDHLGRYPQWQHKIPGLGELDYVPIVRALQRTGFEGSLAIECFTDMPLAQACEVGYKTMFLAFRECGLRFCER